MWRAITQIDYPTLTALLRQAPYIPLASALLGTSNLKSNRKYVIMNVKSLKVAYRAELSFWMFSCSFICMVYNV